MSNYSRYEPPIASVRDANKPYHSQQKSTYSDPSSQDSLVSSVAPSILPPNKSGYSSYQEQNTPQGYVVPQMQTYSGYDSSNSASYIPEAQAYHPSTKASGSQDYQGNLSQNQYIQEARTFRPSGAGASAPIANTAADTYGEYYQNKNPVDSRPADNYSNYQPSPNTEAQLHNQNNQSNVKLMSAYPEDQYQNIQQYNVQHSGNQYSKSSSDSAVKQQGTFTGNQQNSQNYQNEPINIGFSEKSDGRKDSTSSVGETHPHKYTSVADEYDRGSRRNRKFCCCFSSRRSCVICIVLTVVILLAGLGLAVFFLFPRIPTYKVSDPYLLNGVNSVIVSGSPLGTSATSPFSLTIMLAMNISLTSQNYIDYVVKALTVNGTLLHPNGTANAKMTGYGLIADTNFKKMDTTNAIAPFNITYKSTSPVISGTTIDPDLNELLTSCAFTGGQPSSLTISYTAVLDAPLISWITKPSYSDKTTFTCPITSAMWSSLNLVNLLSGK
ncbi:hypothetical protein HK096_008673 [Nowakowskiella sp. JEL0078]|nr:hypothetical protein HK096_008673 [Nowakowskiella sp. JEL0078]